MTEQNKLKLVKLIIFKHGISYFIHQGKIKGEGIFELEFKVEEMNDVLKSLFALDTSDRGYISFISYDAALEASQLLKSIMLDISDTDTFSSLITQIKGALIQLRIGTSQSISGTIMGLEMIEKVIKEETITEKLLIILQEDNTIAKIPFSEISSLKILNEDLNKELKFFLDTSIASKKKDSKKITIHCKSYGEDSVEREIIVSYLRETPIWKTSYRIIMSKKQAQEEKCLLAGYALIENTTDDDWKDIEITLIAGMPVSFIYDFYHPIFIERPKITPPRVHSTRPSEIEEGFEPEEFMDYKMKAEAEYIPDKKLAPRKAKLMTGAMAPKPAPPPAPMPVTTMDDETLRDKLVAQTSAKTKALGELFEYNITTPVTILRKQSALVPILTEEIKAKRILLYNKLECEEHPNACLEIENNTELAIERGPVTIIYDNNLAGEAIIPFLNKGDVRLLNYAVEQAVVIFYEVKSQDLKIHKISFKGAYCYEYYYSNTFTTYKIRNKTDENKIFYLDHPKTSGYHIKESSVEPEKTPNFWRFKLELKPKKSLSFKIKEQKENYYSHYLWNWDQDYFMSKIAFYTNQKFIDDELESKLKIIGELLGKKNLLLKKKSTLENEKEQMSKEQERLRENVSVLGTSTQENRLRENYVQKLSRQEQRFEVINRELKALEQEINEIEHQIEEKINALDFN
ncbi:MAG: hypothetical protein ACTSWE_01990 [Promethearchaeota archaeon]